MYCSCNCFLKNSFTCLLMEMFIGLDQARGVGEWKTHMNLMCVFHFFRSFFRVECYQGCWMWSHIHLKYKPTIASKGVCCHEGLFHNRYTQISCCSRRSRMEDVHCPLTLSIIPRARLSFFSISHWLPQTEQSSMEQWSPWHNPALSPPWTNCYESELYASCLESGSEDDIMQFFPL